MGKAKKAGRQAGDAEHGAEPEQKKVKTAAEAPVEEAPEGMDVNASKPAKDGNPKADKPAEPKPSKEEKAAKAQAAKEQKEAAKQQKAAEAQAAKEEKAAKAQAAKDEKAAAKEAKAAEAKAAKEQKTSDAKAAKEQKAADAKAAKEAGKEQKPAKEDKAAEPKTGKAGKADKPSEDKPAPTGKAATEAGEASAEPAPKGKGMKQAADDKPAAEEAGAAPEAKPKAAKKAAPNKASLQAGDMLPGATPDLETDESTEDQKQTVNLSELVKETGLIIFAYPKANTGGCTKQACGFRDNFEEIKGAGFRVFGLSADKPKSQASWKAKYNLNFNLLTDPTGEVLKLFGFARGDKGINRSHIVIDKGGQVKDVRISISPGDSIAEALKTATS